MIWKYTAAWFGMMFIAILNGAAREAFFKAPLGELRAHQLSTATLLILLSLYIRILIRVRRPESAGQALLIGFIWLAMTLAFEFGFGHFIAGDPWSKLIADYNLFAGRVWVLIPAWLTVAPCLFYRLQARGLT